MCPAFGFGEPTVVSPAGAQLFLDELVEEDDTTPLHDEAPVRTADLGVTSHTKTGSNF
jgi:hypothetical protein